MAKKSQSPRSSSRKPQKALTKALSNASSSSAQLAADMADDNVTLINLRPDGARMIREARLMRFPNRTKVRRYTIEFTCPEFTCVCPASGFPDFATLFIRYVPREYCVELKSLKLYINQFRDRGIFHEDVSNLILDELVKLLDPWEMEVVGDFSVRGNIKTVIRAKHVRHDSEKELAKEIKAQSRR